MQHQVETQLECLRHEQGPLVLVTAANAEMRLTESQDFETDTEEKLLAVLCLGEQHHCLPFLFQNTKGGDHLAKLFQTPHNVSSPTTEQSFGAGSLPKAGLVLILLHCLKANPAENPE